MLIHLGASKAQQTNPALQGKPALAIVGCGLEFASGGKLLSRSAVSRRQPKAPVHTRDNRVFLRCSPLPEAETLGEQLVRRRRPSGCRRRIPRGSLASIRQLWRGESAARWNQREFTWVTRVEFSMAVTATATYGVLESLVSRRPFPHGIVQVPQRLTPIALRALSRPLLREKLS
jgi:hypothetical protein